MLETAEEHIKAIVERKPLDISICREALDRALDIQSPDDLPGVVNHFATVGLAESYNSGTKLPFWEDVTNNLVNLRKQITQEVFDKKVTVDEASLSIKIVDAILQLPEIARQRADFAKEQISTDEMSEAVGSGLIEGELPSAIITR